MERKLGRLEKRQDALKDDVHGKVFDICLTLKMSKEGSFCDLSEYDEKRYLEFLKAVLETWENSRLSSNINSIIFDELVKKMCEVTLKMYEEPR